MKVLVEGLATEYRDDGSGPVWLYLHGWKDDIHTFDALITSLNEHRSVRLDLPGFGASEIPKNSWSVADYVQFVRAFTDKIDVTPDVIIGHSMGGRIAIRGVADGVFKPRRLVLIASAGVAERNAFRARGLLILAKIAKAITSLPPLDRMQEPLRRFIYGPARSDYENSGPLRKTFLKVISENLSSAAEKITVPTLLIWGSRDEATPLEEGERLYALISSSKLDVAEGVGHFVHRDVPDKVAKYMRDFCDS